MLNNETCQKLFLAFHKGIVNSSLEFIAYPHQRVNSFFRLNGCNTEEDVAAKVLEWLSRDAFKGQYFASERRNTEIRDYHLNGINSFCGTGFSRDNMELIYCRLGNSIRHDLTVKFIRSGYDLSVLERRGL